MARGGGKAYGAGAAARCSGVGWSGGSATARGATSDVLAALYLSEGQAEQPTSCRSYSRSYSHCGQTRRGGRRSARNRRGKRRQEGMGTVRRGRKARVGRADRPAVATRSHGLTVRPQLPPIARAVDFTRDRRFVRRVVSLVVRFDPPAANFGEHHREVEEHRTSGSMSGSLHRPAPK
eukprot:scaffold37830_cov55-Phaeocystis_antarctica.AAC.2